MGLLNLGATLNTALAPVTNAITGTTAAVTIGQPASEPKDTVALERLQLHMQATTRAEAMAGLRAQADKWFGPGANYVMTELTAIVVDPEVLGSAVRWNVMAYFVLSRP